MLVISTGTQRITQLPVKLPKVGGKARAVGLQRVARARGSRHAAVVCSVTRARHTVHVFCPRMQTPGESPQ